MGFTVFEGKRFNEMVALDDNPIILFLQLTHLIQLFCFELSSFPYPWNDHTFTSGVGVLPFSQFVKFAVFIQGEDEYN